MINFKAMTRQELEAYCENVQKQMSRINGVKFCSRCKTYKVQGDFNRDASTKDGFKCYCSSCMREYGKKWRKENCGYVRNAAQARRELEKERRTREGKQ